MVEPKIFMQKGMVCTVTNFKFSVDSDLLVDSFIEFSFLPAMLAYWMEIAFLHLKEAQKNHKFVIANLEEEGEKLSESLELEFLSSMQAIVSAAIAIDSFYSEVKGCVIVTDHQREIWRNNKTARWKQVSEVLKLAYKLDNNNFQKIRQFCRDIYKFRDWAVHPSAESKSPLLYSEINLIVEWRLATYNYQNAFNLVGVAFLMLEALLSYGYSKDAKLAARSRHIYDKFHGVYELWHDCFDTRTGAQG